MITTVAAALAGAVMLAIIIMMVRLARQPSGTTTAQANAIEAGLEVAR